MKLGASFSHPHLKYLGLDLIDSLKEFNSLGLRWIRLGCYWSEIEKRHGKYDFSNIDPLVKYCEKNDINIVMTLGMKCFRYPEYYFPSWIDTDRKKFFFFKDNSDIHKYTLKLIEKCIKHYKGFGSVKVWQVENEPLDPSGPEGRRIEHSFLKKEVELVKSLDPKRKVLLTSWGNEIGTRYDLPKLSNLSDIVGVNLYLKHEFSVKGKFIKYVGPMHSKSALKKKVEKIKYEGKKVWITELQAEPWEPDEIVTEKESPPSFLPKHFEKNLSYAKSFNPDAVHLWGFEYWLWRKIKRNDDRYWKKAKEEIKKFI